ncbi:ATP-dependent helicase [Pseudobacteriovorax antillogorgiicola]|uniref:DNA 3'-5' helicase n=1 Tax=Pseudobacteriovorax antillogorgiicola TaxID=1513793 RepID=A0A1Y6B445_9BACT|nr:UvrD-helicase domain-containing protein [Pseudobacteriovorax antillogorgiicola]TCS59178.1 DNA helicase-2/ATP-dependent DNA helicase PcrA [Pseudobacteriovorax antillogorgiicola]SME90860.1 DNA helicase-2 / ATP-dependent DNA helicase PcrA [Pseudobacteriovorax antillogorgiicola]
MIDISGLNSQQHEAVTTISGPSMILAGAGTGKTRVITYRIGHMIDQGIQPEQIVAMTFTNKAAREMKERLISLVGSHGKGIMVGTFHSFCIKILRRFAEEADLDPRFSLAGTSDQLDLVRRSLEEKGWHGLYKPDDILSRISRAKNALLIPETMLEEALQAKFEDEDLSFLKEVYQLYERQLKLNRVIDFDDCILKTALVLRRRSDVLERLQGEYTHFLVDEFQDTNFAQLSILELLAGKLNNICVVGDDDQSIYSWRGAMVETLDRFENIFKGTKLIKLEQNYRCTNVILNAANNVIKNNQGRKDKTLWSKSQSEEYITLTSKRDDGEEARWIAQKCFGLLGQGYRPKDIGILYRANSQARSLETALRERNLVYKVYGGSSFFERKEVRDFLAYFKLSLDPHDRMSFWRVINTPSRGVGLKTLERIEERSKELKISPFEVLVRNEVKLVGKANDAVGQFVKDVQSQSKWPIIHIDDLEKRGGEIIKAFGLEDDIRQKTSHEGAKKRKLESLKKLPEWIKGIGENQVEERGSLNILDLLDQLTLSDDKSGKNDKGPENHISLMTIHASKGLEFPAVFVCGIEDDLLPHKNSIDCPMSVQEERRLFYVAITRAKVKLHLSFARERFSNFQKQDRKPSRFLKELPKTGVVTDTELQSLNHLTSEQDRRERNAKRLSRLRDSIKGGFS